MLKNATWLFLFLLAFAWKAEAKDCTRDEALAADTGIDNLRSWPAIYEAFKKYGHCDSGGIAEGWTQAVVHGLASNWESVAQVEQYAKKDDGFRRFVLRHIDASADINEVRAIGNLAQSRCPPKLDALCEDIEVSVQAALREY